MANARAFGCRLDVSSRWWAHPSRPVTVHDTVHGLSYFEVPKAASEAIEAALLVRRSQLLAASNSSGHRTSTRPLPPFNFSCAREPIERFVSGYNMLTAPRVRPVLCEHLGPRSPLCAPPLADALHELERFVSTLETNGWLNWHIWPQVLHLGSAHGVVGANLQRLCHLGSKASSSQPSNTTSDPHGASSEASLRLERELRSAYATACEARGLPVDCGGLLSPDRWRRDTATAAAVERRLSLSRGAHALLSKAHSHAVDAGPAGAALPEALVLRLCQLYHADYCCLGFELPATCSRSRAVPTCNPASSTDRTSVRVQPGPVGRPPPQLDAHQYGRRVGVTHGGRQR